jgi:hypothetical protein
MKAYKVGGYSMEEGAMEVDPDSIDDAAMAIVDMLSSEVDRLTELTKRHKNVMLRKNILVSVYTNASGFLWQMMKVDSGTDLGWSGFEGDCEMSGTFMSYENALEDALNLLEGKDLKMFEKLPDFWGWGDFAIWLKDQKTN